MAARIVSGLMIVYLVWRGVQAIGQYRAGHVQARRWWFVPWWQLGKPDRLLGSSTRFRANDSSLFWFWTIVQAVAIILLIAFFSLVLLTA